MQILTTLREIIRYADEPSIMRYIKIAATLRDKTVRDVALRCRWMTKEKSGKRRKPEDHYTGKKMKDRKEKLVESSSKASLPPVPPQNIPAHPLMMRHMDRDRIHCCEALAVGSITNQLLDENVQVFRQISANLLRFKMQDNINLFGHTRNNITAILNDMKEMPGIMSQMPPLPVAINEELANTILPSISETSMFGSTRGIHLKQEPGF
ncbi:uncharacterized protein LOC122080925 [Macadamia integrifolia]|uniref:uncharacterized protein LOC122080925 n=1 Tax=Macadamia integrifolia TaxID=60698 RepID=UPI001C4E8075|nr:uncharacterized protein LOC122080925 [Macadamia integrifolia]